MKSRYLLAALLAAATIAPVASYAQEAAPAANPASQIPASDKQAIQNYNLTEDVFNRIVKVSQEAKKEGKKNPNNPKKGQQQQQPVAATETLPAAAGAADVSSASAGGELARTDPVAAILAAVSTSPHESKDLSEL